MIPVALPTYNRPHYLRQTLLWLESNKLADEILLVTSEEPNKECQELLSNTTLKTERTINNKRLGLCANVCQAISKAAEKADWFACVEDDVLIGYDALELANFALELDPNKAGAKVVSFENPHNYSDLIDRLGVIAYDNWFHCHGWAATSEVWLDFMRNFDPNKYPDQSWANPFNYYLQNQPQWLIATPTIGRSFYIGVHGQFSNPEKYKKHVGNVWSGMKEPRKYYLEENWCRDSAPSRGYILNECKVFYERSKR